MSTNERVIELEGYTIAEAESQLSAEDFIVIEKTVLRPEKVMTVVSTAETVEAAALEAQSRMPGDARAEKQEVRVEPRRQALSAEGYEEEGARGEILLQEGEVVESISLRKKGRKGFLGFFKRPNIYEVIVSRPAVVAVTFRERVRIRLRVRGYSAADLLRSVAELRGRGAPWDEMLVILNPKGESRVAKLLLSLRDRFSCDERTALGLIEDACRRSEGERWEAPLRRALEDLAFKEELERIARRKKEEAERLERIRRANAERIELRRLDHQIAENLMLYHDIYWDREYRELKGIPRWSWPQPRFPDPRERETIPHYSSNEEDFRGLRQRISYLLELYLQVLREADRDEAVASLKHRCEAVLEARKRWRQK